MSPILIRPVREQIEHDRIIRVLQARLRREFAVEANLGDERRVPVRVGEQVFYPDLVLTATGSSRKVQAIIEVETTESVNHLEAMAEWAHFGKARAPFHLYVPAGLIDIARRLIETYQISIAQLWSYSPVGDQVHFWLVSGDGDGAILTSVTDSISAAEPVTPAVPEAVAAGGAPAAEPAGDLAQPSSEPQPARKAAAPARSVKATPPSRGVKTAAPAAAVRSVKPGAKVAKAEVKAAKKKPAARAASSRAGKAAAAQPAVKARGTTAAKPAVKSAARRAAPPKKAASAARKPAAKPASKPAAKAAARRKPAARPGATRHR